MDRPYRAKSFYLPEPIPILGFVFVFPNNETETGFSVAGYITVKSRAKVYLTSKSNLFLLTLPTTEILNGKNVRAWVSMDFT